MSNHLSEAIKAVLRPAAPPPYQYVGEHKHEDGSNTHVFSGADGDFVVHRQADGGTHMIHAPADADGYGQDHYDAMKSSSKNRGVPHSVLKAAALGMGKAYGDE